MAKIKYIGSDGNVIEVDAIIESYYKDINGKHFREGDRVRVTHYKNKFHEVFGFNAKMEDTVFTVDEIKGEKEVTYEAVLQYRENDGLYTEAPKDKEGYYWFDHVECAQDKGCFSYMEFEILNR